MSSNIVKPFLKWVGGKTQIIDKVIDKFPKEMNNYHEIFVGGGSVLLALLSSQRDDLITINGTIYAYDLNTALITTYKHVQSNPEELYNEIETLITEYSDIIGDEINRKSTTIEEASTSQESYYYWIRYRYNNLTLDEKECVLASAMFIFLNKLCFRGVFREGPNGFNVPFGHYKTVPTIVTKEHLLEVQELIKDVQFINSDFSDSIETAIENDFVYLDPPYAPEMKTSFVGYTKDGFSIEQHERLFQLIKDLSKKNIKFTMSNSNVKLIQTNFPKTEYTVDEIICRRAINSKKPESTAKEVLICN